MSFIKAGRTQDEEGAVAVLYSITMLLMIALIAFGLELGAMRFDRRASQSAADMAATAGGLSLMSSTDFIGSPELACEAAWDYFLTNTTDTPDDTPDPCGAWVGAICSSPPAPVEQQVGPYFFRVTWPVPADSPLMDGRYDADIDGGVAGCDRIAVQIRRTRGFIFGRIFDIDQATVGAPAVARATLEQGPKIVAALVILDPFGCQALLAGGGGATGRVHVWEDVEDGPGVIAIDSDASACGNSPNDLAIRLNGSGHEVKAGVMSDSGTVRNGFMFMTSVNTRPEKAYDPDAVITSADDDGLGGGFPSPRVPVGADPMTRKLWEHRYDCKDSYPYGLTDPRPHHEVRPCVPEEDADGPHMSDLRTRLSSDETAIQGLDPALRPIEALLRGYTYVNTCSITDEQSWDLLAGTDAFWVDCPSLEIKNGGSLTIDDGDVVLVGTAGNDSLILRGTFRVNADGDGESNHLAILAGDVWKTGGSPRFALGTPEDASGDESGTFVYLRNGRINMGGTDSPEFDWFAPYDGPFEDLSLWSDSSADHELGGNLTSLRAEGIFYMPNAMFDFGGGGEMGQQRAQFIAYRMWAHGNGALRMRPDPSRAEPSHLPAVSLIR